MNIEEIRETKWMNGFDYSSGFILIRREGEERKQIRVDYFDYYFLIRLSDFEKAKPVLRILRKDGHLKRASKTGDWVKLYVENTGRKVENNPRDIVVKALNKTGVETYESDLGNVERFCIDNEIEIATNNKLLYFDIETDDRMGVIDVGKQRVLSIGFIDGTGKRWWFCDDDEGKVLRQANELIRKYDVVIGYNSEKFDVPVLNRRFEMHGIDRLPRHVVCFDLYKRLERTVFRFGSSGGLATRSWGLDDVAEAAIGVGKVERTGTVWSLFENDRGKLEEYNMRDVELLKGVDEKLNVTNLVLKQCEVCGRFMSERVYVSHFLDMYFLKASNRVGFHLPRRPDYVIGESKIIGGYVYDSNPGIYRDVYVYDFSSMYPRIIINWNMGPDTYLETPERGNANIAPNGHGFKKRPVGIFNAIITKLLEERKHYRDIEGKAETGSPEWKNAEVSQTTIKGLTNACYGMFAHTGSRVFKREIAESITLAGRHLNKHMGKFFTDRGATLVFSDTDSCAVSLPEETDPNGILDELLEEIPKELKTEFDIDDGRFDIKLEKKFSRLVVVAKKQYAGWLSEEDGEPADRMEVRGLETVKRDTTEIARKSLDALLRRLLRSDDPPNAEGMAEWVIGLRERVFNKDFSVDDVTIRQVVKQNINEYKGERLPVHAEVAKTMVEDGRDFWMGQDVRYVIVAERPQLRGVPAYHEEAKDWDRVYYWNRRIYSKLRRVLEVVYPDYPWGVYDVVNGGSHNSYQKTML